jgi:predicted lipid-binding transport protein (Tim44 family)
VPADILIYAIVTAGLVFWLRSILGTNGDDGSQNPNQLSSHHQKSGTPASDKNDKETTSVLFPGMSAIGDEAPKPNLESSMSIGNQEAEVGLAKIAHSDKNFDLAHFLYGSQDAFTMIVEAFSVGDKETLKNLLCDHVYKSFEKVVDDREKSGQRATVDIYSIRKTEIVDAKLEDKTAYITVRFVADETNIVYDKDDKIISGDPDRVTETIDIWTFCREINSRDPAWYLFETRDEDATEEDHKTVPDSE